MFASMIYTAFTKTDRLWIYLWGYILILLSYYLSVSDWNWIFCQKKNKIKFLFLFQQKRLKNLGIFIICLMHCAGLAKPWEAGTGGNKSRLVECMAEGCNVKILQSHSRGAQDVGGGGQRGCLGVEKVMDLALNNSNFQLKMLTAGTATL